MKKQIKILKKIKNYIEKIQIQKENERLEEKQSKLNLLNRTWTEAQIQSYNYMLMLNSSFWIGGDYTELDIKKQILRENAHLFTEEEYVELYNKIYSKQKIR